MYRRKGAGDADMSTIEVDAERALSVGKAALAQDAGNVQRHIVEDLVEALEALLDAHADLSAIYDPPYDDDGKQEDFYLDVDPNDDGTLDPYETFDEE